MTGAVAAAAAVAVPTPEARLKALYSVMQSIENKLGGGEGVEGLYGSIKKSGMDKVLGCMAERCGLDCRSTLLDVGAGLGRPLMHALLAPGVAGARGIEIDRIKCDKADAFLSQAVRELRRRGLAGSELAPPPIDCSAIENVRSLDPCTHAYSFWEGVPAEGKAAFGRLFAASRTLRSVAVVQRAIRTCPLAYMADLGFGELDLVGSFSVSMSGSGRSFTAYIFNKAHPPEVLPAPLAAEQAAAQSVQTPAQAAEAAAALTSVGAVAAAAEMDGESAQSGLVAAGGDRGRRQRRPSVKQRAAQEQAEEQLPQAVEGRQPAEAPRRRQQRQQQPQPPLPLQEQELQQQEPAGSQQQEPTLSARQQRAQRRSVAVWEAAKATGQQQQQAQQQAQAAAPSRASRARSASRPAAAAAAKLSSPQKGGVQKRASPVKAASTAGTRSPEQAPRTSPRRLSLGLPAAGEQPAAAAAQPPPPQAPAAPAAAAPASPGREARSRSASRPTAKLSSPQKGGVQKRASPVKAAAASSPGQPVRTSPRKLAVNLSASDSLAGAGGKGAKAAAALLPAPGGAGSLKGYARVSRAGGAAAAAAKLEAAMAAAPRRGLRGSDHAAA